MAFTAKDVMELRQKTGCGMMDCKKALTEADGDMEKAIDVLREQGLAKAAKKASRIAAEGVAFACTNEDATMGVALEVNAETDFVAKNAEFQAFVKAVADTIMAEKPATVEELMTKTVVGGTVTVAELLQEKIQTIGENTGFLYSGDINRLTGILAAADLKDLSVAEPDLEEIILHYYEKGGEQA